MDHIRIEPRTSTAPHGTIRRLSTAGLATVVAGAFMLFSIVGSGRAQAPTRSFELLEATIPDLQAALAAVAVDPRVPGTTIPGPADALAATWAALDDHHSLL